MVCYPNAAQSFPITALTSTKQRSSLQSCTEHTPNASATDAKSPATASTSPVLPLLLAFSTKAPRHDNTTHLFSTAHTRPFSHKSPNPPAQTASTLAVLYKSSSLQTSSQFSRFTPLTVFYYTTLLASFLSTNHSTIFVMVSSSFSSSQQSNVSNRYRSSPLPASVILSVLYFPSVSPFSDSSTPSSPPLSGKRLPTTSTLSFIFRQNPHSQLFLHSKRQSLHARRKRLSHARHRLPYHRRSLRPLLKPSPLSFHCLHPRHVLRLSLFSNAIPPFFSQENSLSRQSTTRSAL